MREILCLAQSIWIRPILRQGVLFKTPLLLPEPFGEANLKTCHINVCEVSPRASSSDT